MNTNITSRPRTGLNDHLEEAIEAACRIAGRRRNIRAVSVVLPARPTYSDLRRYQELAQAGNLSLRVDPSGVTVRPQPTHTRSGRQHIVRAQWLHELQGMTEGTR
jgi:hypothetical protein